MTEAKRHHNLLIDMAVKDGWVRGHAWRSALHRIGVDHGYGELAELEESFGDPLPRPDAWRIVIERPDTSDQMWLRPMIVLEFLEIEVTSGITQTKDELYRWLWDIFDATNHFHLRIWHMDRFGVVRPYINESSFYPKVFGMTAGWRS